MNKTTQKFTVYVQHGTGACSDYYSRRSFDSLDAAIVFANTIDGSNGWDRWVSIFADDPRDSATKCLWSKTTH